MRNSSDIFCLKEAKAGENDGSMIFSVNGARSVRINRRSSNPMDGFQYGSNSSTDGDSFRSRSEILKTDSEELTADHPNLSAECDDGDDSPRSMDGAMDMEPKTSKSSDEVNSFVRLEKNVDGDGNISSIKRNILTGAGMEVDSTPMKKKTNNNWTR